MKITVNPDPDIEIVTIGNIDVLIADNILKDPDELREYGIESYKKYTKKYRCRKFFIS